MDVETSGKPTGNKRTYTRLPRQVCVFWQEGRCTRESCNFLHVDEPGSVKRGGATNGFAPKRSYNGSDERDMQAAGPPGGSRRNISARWGRGRGGIFISDQRQKIRNKVCNYWLAGNCQRGEECKYLHYFVMGSDVKFLTQLSGHVKAIRGIAFPSDSGKLYSGGQDKKVIVWDCQTGQGRDIPLNDEVGCLMSEGPWIFVGLPNAVKAWNILTSTELSLVGPRGQVHALAVGNGMLFAGTHDGSILGWKFSPASNTFEPAASLVGHTQAVVSLVSGADRLYSGSMDKTIRVWDLGTFQCLQTLRDHTSVVMSLLCWDQFLLSCSLDSTVKVWVATPSGALEVTYTHNEEHGVLALCGMNDEQAKPVLLCSCNDNTVRLYDLPSFSERGKIFSRNEVRTFQIAPGGLFFTGDATGELKVWNWATQTS